MADHSKPVLAGTSYPDFRDQLMARIDDALRSLDPAVTSPTNLPQYAIRWSSAAKKWQIWSGTAWGDLAAEYAISISGSAATLKTARTIALSGGATGTATSFNGSANITIPVTALDASKLAGTIPSGLLDGKADKAITITGTGYLTGGGSLAANRAIDLDPAVKAKFDRFLPAYTFAEIDALPSNIGPILCTDMGPSFLYVWTTSVYFTGYRSVFCGELPRNFAPSPRAWEALITGGVWSESDPKQKRLIALFREQGLVIAAGSWKKGDGYIADLGSGNWKAPDLQDQFLRIAGTDVDTANPRAVGSYQADALQNIVGALRHRVNRGLFGTDGTNGAFYADVDNSQMGSVSPIDAISGANEQAKFDASRVARTSSETRGRSTAVAPAILI